MIFPEMMAEMRRPMDFYKGMAMAQMLIFVVYLVYGIFCKYLTTNMYFPWNWFVMYARRVLFPGSIHATQLFPGVHLVFRPVFLQEVDSVLILNSLSPFDWQTACNVLIM